MEDEKVKVVRRKRMVSFGDVGGEGTELGSGKGGRRAEEAGWR